MNLPSISISFIDAAPSIAARQSSTCLTLVSKLDSPLLRPSLVDSFGFQQISDQQTAIGSSNVPNTVDEPVKIQTKNGRRRQTRERTLLKDLYNLNYVERVKVSRSSHGQLIGSEAQVLVGYLGIIARNANLLPINYESWHHMLDSNKNHALDNIKVRFALEASDNYVKKALANKWRDHKCTLKKKEYLKKNISLEEKL
ncbi:hypothetical protein J1N35_011083 [Gossypium stocksii]|uniref:Uncharacterized protein n=1 Tax=Gossypium stocksii TaxID=47602 RepID=A0A9D3W3C4_9ROSI|nr:hypothetical protein J1N35_011083 [Gossypium stocksii]